jgi:dipeptidyl aminopeptidase/acylaminoacyl peptidase
MKSMIAPHRSRLVGLFCILTLLLLNFPSRAEEQPNIPIPLSKQYQSFSSLPSSVTWGKTVPQVKTIRIRSSADGSLQPALYYDSGSDKKKPLLVALHSWSDNYTQRVSVPYGVWCVSNDWVLIHPDYRGVFNRSDATGSDLAVQDIVDAVNYARKNANIDASRIYLMGFSGGAMMSLIMAGRYPEMWTAVSAWVPVFNLTEWYSYVRRFPNRHYARHIVSSCGGIPKSGTAAEAQCNKRSPSTYLKNARGKGVQIYIAHGIKDDFAQPGHALRAFNELVDDKDKISTEDIRFIDSKGQLPSGLAGNIDDEFYRTAGKRLLFKRISGNATVTLFNGEHDVLYNVGLQWLSQQTWKSE